MAQPFDECAAMADAFFRPLGKQGDFANMRPVALTQPSGLCQWHEFIPFDLQLAKD